MVDKLSLTILGTFLFFGTGLVNYYKEMKDEGNEFTKPSDSKTTNYSTANEKNLIEENISSSTSITEQTTSQNKTNIWESKSTTGKYNEITNYKEIIVDGKEITEPSNIVTTNYSTANGENATEEKINSSISILGTFLLFCTEMLNYYKEINETGNNFTKSRDNKTSNYLTVNDKNLTEENINFSTSIAEQTTSQDKITIWETKSTTEEYNEMNNSTSTTENAWYYLKTMPSKLLNMVNNFFEDFVNRSRNNSIRYQPTFYNNPFQLPFN
ncbi:uncharacterized protein LOC122512013 [Leptopilina heterotoma]|uniref:uncharacterized protein LOC122512013 n=1 Tax=Leptopilina heterotoma TaxID=63436 RepID=UPI001CAA3E3A|nr:uncharacterized protein LOC122512013 [Leptopilina heterotoma]